jgi:hypothetical protein
MKYRSVQAYIQRHAQKRIYGVIRDNSQRIAGSEPVRRPSKCDHLQRI